MIDEEFVSSGAELEGMEFMAEHKNWLKLPFTPISEAKIRTKDLKKHLSVYLQVLKKTALHW